MIEIKLTKGKVTVVDDDDYTLAFKYKWIAAKSHWGNALWYASKHVKRPDGKWRPIFLHRLIVNAAAGMEVDHINGDGLDNRRSNLRICTHAQNSRNSRSVNPNKTSKYKGVYKDRGY